MNNGQRTLLRGMNARARCVASRSLISLLLFLPTLALANAAFAQSAPEPFVSTDRKDYSPGDTVTISAGNFQPGEVVTITVQSPVRADRLVTSVAAADGSFTNTEFSPDEGDREVFIKIVATGELSGPDLAAIAYFYDATPIGACPFTVDASIAASIPASSLLQDDPRSGHRSSEPWPLHNKHQSRCWRHHLSRECDHRPRKQRCDGDGLDQFRSAQHDSSRGG